MRWIGLILGVLCLSSVNAQDVLRWIALGQQATEQNDHYGAVHYYGEAFRLDSTNMELQYAYAESLRATKEYERAKDLYLRVYRKGRGRFYPEGAAHIAQMMMHLEEYENSIEFWRRALRKTEDADSLRIQQRMRSCAYALTHLEPRAGMQVENMGPLVNSTESDFGGSYQDSLLLFASMRGKFDEQLALEDPLDYQISLYAYTGRGKASPWEGEIPAGADILNPAFDEQGTSLYFSLCPEGNPCRIYRQDWPKGTREVLPAPVNLDALPSTMPFPCHINGKDALLYSARRPSGRGGLDLYLWYAGEAEAIPLLGCNSPGDEISPSYDPEEDLIYFSSDWHEGFGGQDIFSINLEEALNGGSPSNLGKPMNSSVNDMYFRWSGEKGILTSNREGSMTIKGKNCCNDLYAVMRDEPIEELVETDSILDQSIPSSIASVSELREKLPIQLFFHNDVPNPGSVATYTELSYAETAREYLEMLEKYQAQAVDSLAEVAITKFFEKQIRGEFERLDEVTDLIQKELEKGRSIEVAIKGFASPLAKSDYNRRLTKRRISSVVNYFKQYRAGVLMPYLETESDVQLRIRPIPYGEDEAYIGVSDDLNNRKLSVYSMAAAFERRVEILKVEELTRP